MLWRAIAHYGRRGDSGAGSSGSSCGSVGGGGGTVCLVGGGCGIILFFDGGGRGGAPYLRPSEGPWVDCARFSVRVSGSSSSSCGLSRVPHIPGIPFLGRPITKRRNFRDVRFRWRVGPCRSTFPAVASLGVLQLGLIC